MTISISLHEISAHFPNLFAQVLEGEEIIIAEEGKELMRVIPGKDAVAPRTSQQNGLGEQTLAEALTGMIGTISLENAPSARDAKQVFGAIVEEKLSKRRPSA